MAGLGPDGFTCLQRAGEVGSPNPYGLFLPRAKVHLDATLVLVISDLVREVPQHEVPIDLAIDTGQQIEVERGGDTGGIVVGWQEVGHRLLQISAKHQRIAG